MKKQLLLVAALIVMASTLFAQIPSYVPTNGLVGWWPFNGNANDESGNGNNGIVNGAALTVDRFGNDGEAYNLNVIGSKIDLISSNSYLGSSNHTISFWFKTSFNGNEQYLLSKRPTCLGYNEEFFGFLIDPNSNLIKYSRAGGQIETIQFSPNVWNNYVFTRNGNITIIYLNGVLLVNSGWQYDYSPNAMLGVSSTNACIANFGQDYKRYIGDFDDLGIWNRALTQQEITALYQSQVCTLTATITPQGNTTFLQGESVTLNANTGANYTYQWYQNGNAISSATVSNYQATQTGTYTVKVTDGACTDTSAGLEVNVSQPPVSSNCFPNYVPKNGLVGWWPFCNSANDESGNGNNGTLTNATIGTDRNNNANSAYDFSNGYVTIAETNYSVTSQITVGAWVNLSKNNYHRIVAKHGGCCSGTNYGWMLARNANGNNYEWLISNNGSNWDGGQTPAGTALLDTWQFLVVTYDGSYMRFYIDGVEIKSNVFPKAQNGSIYKSTFPLSIGRDGTFTNNYGKIDDVGIWNRALTQQEITALYQSQVCTLTATITPQGNTTFCQGGSVTLNANTGTNYTYQWYQNANAIPSATVSNYQATQTGTYTVKITDGACNATSAGAAVTVNALPSVSLTPIANYINFNNSAVNLSANPAGGVFSGSGVSGNMFNPKNAGLGIKTISYSYTNTVGCFNKTSQNTLVYDTTGVVCTKRDTVTTYITVTDTLVINTLITGISSSNQTTTIKVFPNPTNDHITILYGDFTQMNGYTLKITNALGQLMFSSPINQASSYIDLASWTGKGIYFVHILNPQNNAVEVRKIVLQ